MAMRVQVRYLGPVRVMLKTRDETVALSSPASLLDLLRALAARYGPAFRAEVLDEHDGLQESLLVTVNGVAIGQLSGLATRLRDDDVVTLLPFFAGGGQG
jgi:molybdopterin converting factor small subunit